MLVYLLTLAGIGLDQGWAFYVLVPLLCFELVALALRTAAIIRSR